MCDLAEFGAKGCHQNNLFPKVMSAIIKALIEAAGPGVAMFSKSVCPYCKKAKAALLNIGITAEVVELDLREGT